MRNRPGNVFVFYIITLFGCINMAKVLNYLKNPLVDYSYR